MAYKKSHVPPFRALARLADQAASQVLVAELDAYAERERARFENRIRRQEFPSFHVLHYPDSPEENKNLSPQWVRRKKSKGASTRTMIATRHYLSHIRVFRRKRRDGRGGVWRIGFHPQIKARDLDGNVADILLNDVALIHEHGNASTPARPHWGPNLQRMKVEAPEVRAQIRRRVLKAVKAAVGDAMVVKGT